MTTGQAIAIAIGFVAAVFAIGMGASMFADWLRAKDQERRRASGVTEAPALVSVEVLRQHWLRAMECDHATGQDKPHCSCSQVDLGWHPSIGAAVEAWLAHVSGVNPSHGSQG